MMLRTLNSNFLDWEDTLTREQFFWYKSHYNIPLQCTYDKTLFPSHVQKTIYHSFDVTTMFKK